MANETGTQSVESAQMMWDMYDSTGLVRNTMPWDEVGLAALANAREDNPVQFVSAGGDGYEDQGPFQFTMTRQA